MGNKISCHRPVRKATGADVLTVRKAVSGTIKDLKNRTSQHDRLASRLNAQGNVTPIDGNDESEEFIVAHQSVPCAATIDLAPLPHERQQRGIDQ